ncbi:MAG: DUF1214 domain-containing protein [Actinomycetota bacterium]|nr:DUF1214 domain-containing protein [Actinomycetota bacterium]
MTEKAIKSLEAWDLVKTMLSSMTEAVVADAETEPELLEGLRVLGRVTALASEVALDGDPERPWLFSMDTPARYVGGPNPDGEYFLAMISGRHRYRVHGWRGTTAYLGFQVLAGVGLTPRRMAAHVSDRDLSLDPDGAFAFVLSADRPGDLDGATWVQIPEDASALVIREYIGDRAAERLAELHIDPLDDSGPPAPLTDEQLAEQLTSWAWTIAKLATLHRTIKPELLDLPNQLVTAAAADLGAADTTPDNLYMIGTFRLQPGECLELEIQPPESRYWSVTLENIWHECLEPRRRRSSMTHASAVQDGDGKVRVRIAAEDPGTANWLDTGGRHRGFVILRWLDNPEAPAVATRLVTGAHA